MFVRVTNCVCGFRSFTEDLKAGKVVITLADGQKRIATVKDSCIVEDKCLKDGKFKYWVKYGLFQKERKDGTTYAVFHYRHNTSRGLHGLTVRKDLKLFGMEGVAYTFYSRGKFIWQKFVYPNRKTAYYFRWTDKEIKGVYSDSKSLFWMKGDVEMRRHKDGLIFFDKSHHFNGNDVFDLSKTGNYEFIYYDTSGRVVHKGEYKNRQRVGEWIANRQKKYYITGVEVTREMYFTPPEKLNPKLALENDNAQLKAVLLSRIGLARVVKECDGKLVHSQGNMRLWDFPTKTEDGILRILKVNCPSTNNEYFLQVPPNIDNCERARQWTFEAEREEKIGFALET